MTRKLLDRWTVRRPTRSAGLAAAIGLALVIGVQAAIAMVGRTPTGAEAIPPPSEAEPSTATAEPSAQPTAEPSEPASPAEAETADEFNLSGGGARLIVNVANQTDSRYVARGRAQLNQIPAPRVGPVNAAIARSTCVDCETLAVALQISVYERGAPFVAPQNAAVAVNGGCLRCFTMAVAIQYLIPVVDHTAVPSDVRRLARDLTTELREVTRDRATPVRARLSKLFDIIDRFRQFAAYLDLRMHDETEPNTVSGDPISSPIPEGTDDPAASPEPLPSPSPSPAEGAASPTPDDQPSPTASPDSPPTESPPSPSESPSSSPVEP